LLKIDIMNLLKLSVVFNYFVVVMKSSLPSNNHPIVNPNTAVISWQNQGPSLLQRTGRVSHNGTIVVCGSMAHN